MCVRCVRHYVGWISSKIFRYITSYPSWTTLCSCLCSHIEPFWCWMSTNTHDSRCMFTCIQFLEHSDMLAVGASSQGGMARFGTVVEGAQPQQLGMTIQRMMCPDSTAGDRFYDMSNTTAWCASQWFGEGDQVSSLLPVCMPHHMIHCGLEFHTRSTLQCTVSEFPGQHNCKCPCSV